MKIQKLYPYLIAFAVLLIAAGTYFYPVFQGKQLPQSDITQFKGMVKDINDYRDKFDTEPYWTQSSFSGMPAYQVSAYYPYDFVRTLDKIIRFLPRPADYTFLYFLSFFVLMMALKVEWRLAILGSLAFGFSTYLIIIFIPGHNSKALAIGYMPLVTAGVLWIFNHKYKLGFIVTALAMALEIYANHIQMTYYLGFCLLILGIVEFIEAIKNKTLPVFFKQSALILAAIFLGLGMNASRLLATKEYASYSTRGKSELTINPDRTKKESTNSGLDKEYITQYSYSKLETFNLIIPRFMGGGTVEKLDEDSNFYQVFEQNFGKKGADYFSQQALTYWGNQPIVEAPAYIGAIIFFLFFLGIFLVKGKLKKWLVAATIFSIILSWGKNFEFVTNLFIDFVPMYNKFRAVSSIQIIAEFCVPILGILALHQFFSSEIDKKQKLEALKKATFVFIGVVAIAFVSAHLFSSFEGIRDNTYLDIEKQYKISGVLDAIIADRKSMLFADTSRSIILTLLAAAVLWFSTQSKINKNGVLLSLAVLLCFDLVSINKNYLNTDDFETARKVEKPFSPTIADQQILDDKSYYRVAAVNPLEDGTTSYFHNSIGGYHAAKMRRYQELFDYQIAKNNMQVLNMLNTKYFMIPDDEGNLQAQLNDDANGAVWLVEDVIKVQTADAEMKALDSLKTKTEVVVNTTKVDGITIANNYVKNEKDTISLTSHNLTELTYNYKADNQVFAVFSEMYYPKGWQAFIDGKPVAHFGVNYVLRGMILPAGTHEIKFEFQPDVIKTGGIISLVSYSLVFIILILFFSYKSVNFINNSKFVEK